MLLILRIFNLLLYLDLNNHLHPSDFLLIYLNIGNYYNIYNIFIILLIIKIGKILWVNLCRNQNTWNI